MTSSSALVVSTCFRSYVAAAVHSTASSSGRPLMHALPPWCPPVSMGRHAAHGHCQGEAAQRYLRELLMARGIYFNAVHFKHDVSVLGWGGRSMRVGKGTRV